MKFGGIASLAAITTGAVMLISPGLPAASQTTGPAASPAGAAIYAEHCAGCHGVTGEGGGGPALRSLEILSPGPLIDFLRKGSPDKGMPAFGSFSNDALLAVTQHVLRMKEVTIPVSQDRVLSRMETELYALDVRVVARNFERPWALAPLPDGSILVTDRHRGLKLVDARNSTVADIAGEPMCAPDEVGAGGLRDVKLSPDYPKSHMIYLTYDCPLASKNGTPLGIIRLVRATLRDRSLRDLEELWPKGDKDLLPLPRNGDGGRMTFGNKGDLYFSVGTFTDEEGTSSQRLDSPFGKIHRIMMDGAIPSDNPYPGTRPALGSIWAIGVRNSQGLAFDHGTGNLWSTDHGEAGGDELDLIQPKGNYGWPTVSWGPKYTGKEFPEGGARPGIIQPTINWTPSIAPAALAIYGGNAFPRWKGDLLVGSLKGQEVQRIVIRDGKPLLRETILARRGRVRDIAVAADGAIYVLTERRDSPTGGEILRIVRARGSGGSVRKMAS